MSLLWTGEIIRFEVRSIGGDGDPRGDALARSAGAQAPTRLVHSAVYLIGGTLDACNVKPSALTPPALTVWVEAEFVFTLLR